jgi:hypothetical protein
MWHVAMRIWNGVPVSWSLYIRDPCRKDTSPARLPLHSMLHLDFFFVAVGRGLRTALVPESASMQLSSVILLLT